MDAIAQALGIYSKHGLSLERDLADYLAFGYVYAEPGRLLMQRPILIDKGDTVWLNPGEKGDCWYIHLAINSGSIGWIMQVMPYFLPRMAWYRQFRAPGSKLHSYETARISKIYPLLRTPIIGTA